MFGAAEGQPGVHVDVDREEASLRIQMSIEEQIQRLEALPHQPSFALDVMRWWRTPAVVLADLAKPAMYLLGVPPSSAAVERTFSAAGRFIDRKRPWLKEETASSYLLAHENLNRGWTGEDRFLSRLNTKEATA